jgi:hypothetical protein
MNEKHTRNHNLESITVHQKPNHSSVTTTSCPPAENTSTTIVRLQLSATFAVAACQDTPTSPAYRTWHQQR